MSKIRVVFKGEGGIMSRPEVREIESSLDSMQALVGGNVDCVPVPGLTEHGIDLWINDEGKFTCKPNFAIFDGRDVVFGPVFCASVDEEGETIGLTDEQVDIATRFLTEARQAIPGI